VFRKSLLRSYAPDATQPVDDRVLAIASGIVVAALLPALVSGVAVWIPAVVAAGILIVFFAVRRRSVLRFRLLPWQIVLFAAGLFFFIAAAQGAGLDRALSVLAGGDRSGDILGLLRIAGVGGVGANLVNNLPAYVALQPIAHTAPRIIGLLIGVNVGPLITPWASLATLLWYERCVTGGVAVPLRRFTLTSTGVAVAGIGLSVAALYWL
jgi:arsenical pump membrane protein